MVHIGGAKFTENAYKGCKSWVEIQPRASQSEPGALWTGRDIENFRIMMHIRGANLCKMNIDKRYQSCNALNLMQYHMQR